MRPSGRGNLGRKVARAAATGARRGKVVYRGRVPIGWYGSLAAVVILGASVVAYTRYEWEHPASATPPTIGSHWLAAIAFDICGKIQPNLPRPANWSIVGITTYGDGLIHIDPKTAADAGNNATLGRFVTEYPGLVLTNHSLELPGKKLWSNGERCGTRPGIVKVETWSSLVAPKGTIYTSDASQIKLENGQLITVGFVPANYSLPKPPSAALLASSGTTTTTSLPTSKTSTTTAAGAKVSPTTTKASKATTSKVASTTSQPASKLGTPSTTGASRPSKG